MAWVIFGETLKRNWRATLYWGIGVGLLGFYIFVVIPDIDALQQYAGLIEALPPAMMQFFGVGSAAAIATPEGFLSFGFFGYAMLILAVYGVIAGLGVIANEEEEGIMDVLLSLPVARWRVMVEKVAAYSLMAIIIVALSLVGLLVGMASSALEVDIGKLIAGSFNMIPTIWLIMVFTVFISAIVRRRGTTIAIAAAFVIASYFLNFLGQVAPNSPAETVSYLSLFRYYDAESVMLDGLNIANIALLIGTAFLFNLGALWFFERRDIGL